jgi:hypothetical protein
MSALASQFVAAGLAKREPAVIAMFENIRVSLSPTPGP